VNSVSIHVSGWQSRMSQIWRHDVGRDQGHHGCTTLYIFGLSTGPLQGTAFNNPRSDHFVIGRRTSLRLVALCGTGVLHRGDPPAVTLSS
jgi:hypothetical protein